MRSGKAVGKAQGRPPGLACPRRRFLASTRASQHAIRPSRRGAGWMYLGASREEPEREACADHRDVRAGKSSLLHEPPPAATGPSIPTTATITRSSRRKPVARRPDQGAAVQRSRRAPGRAVRPGHDPQPGALLPRFDHIVLLSAPPEVPTERLATRATKPEVAQSIPLRQLSAWI